MTQEERVLNYMKDFGSITRLQAFNDIGVAELSARICNLRKQGYRIEREMESSKNRYGETVSYARYKLCEE